MDRISGANYATVGGLRMWQDRNQTTGVQGTFGNAKWFNGVQESILGVVTAAGLVPTDADNAQLLHAIESLITAAAGWPIGCLQDVVTAAGIVPDSTQNMQLLTALGGLFGGGGGLAANGWQRLPGGLIVQWGAGTIPTPTTPQTSTFMNVFFPVVFPHNCFAVVGNAAGYCNSSDQYWPSFCATTESVTGFAAVIDMLDPNNAYNAYINQPVPFKFMALGN